MIPLVGDIDNSALHAFFADLMKALKEKPDKVIVFICSGGGDMDCTGAIIDLLRYCRRSGVTVTTVASGDCQSGAAMIFLAGDDRLISRSCYFMLHNPSLSMSDVSGREGAKLIANCERQFNAILEAATEHSATKPSMIQSKCKNGDWVVTPEEAIKTNVATGWFLEEAPKKRK